MITLDWPPTELRPNARVHFRAKAAVAKLYRETAYYRGEKHDLPLPEAGIEYAAVIKFYPPDKRRRDLDNMLASIKSGVDGLADALGINDRQLNPITIERCEPVKGGKVVVVIV